KQIFDDEIEREKELLLRSRQVEGQLVSEGVAEEVLELEDVGGRALTDSAMRAAQADASHEGEARTVPTSVGRPGSKLEASLTLSFTRRELDELTRMARHHRLTPEELVRELVRGHLKWLG